MQSPLLTSLVYLLIVGWSPSIMAQSYYQKSSRERTLENLQSELSDLKQKLHCYEIEKEILEEKLAKQESLLSSLKSEVKSSQQTNEDSQKSKLSSLEKRVADLEKTDEALLEDIKQFKTHANEMSTALKQLKTKHEELAQYVNSNLAHLKSALESIMKIVQKEPSIPPLIEGDKSLTYRVKPGDTLEKIAKAHKLSLDQLKKYNNLSSDRIKIGQELKVCPS